MISVKKDFNEPPQKLLDSKRDDSIKEIIAAIEKNDPKIKPKFKSSIYRTATIEALEKLYNYKCAYCESDTSVGAPFQVEHFRPKANIKDDDTHKGYYWLAYEWSNLTLGCSSCNNAKSSHFPIVGQRISEPDLDANGLPTNDYLSIKSDFFVGEQALFLNPEIDEVEKHIYFLPNGEIKGLDDRGNKTIELLKLNRKRLRFWRKKILDDYLAEIKGIFEDLLTNSISVEQCQYGIKQVFRRMILNQDVTKPYSRFSFFVIEKFEIFVANQLESKQKDAILKFFELFRKNEL